MDALGETMADTLTEIINSKRYSFKVVGASGQGINSVGEIAALALKKLGFYVFAYREYPSLIKGGHSTYQLDLSPTPVYASTKMLDMLIVLNRQKTNWHLEEMNPGAVIIHDIPNPRINRSEAELMRQKQIKLVYLPAYRIVEEQGGNELMTNIVTTGLLWKLFNLDYSLIEEIVNKMFADKPKFLEADLRCLRAGYDYVQLEQPDFPKRLTQPEEIGDDEKLELHVTDMQVLTSWVKLPQANLNAAEAKLLISGNDALGIGAINAGMRAYFAYPMTPSSSILDYLADQVEKTGIVVKQAEDEITASAMALGAMQMGTRALTGTSGGGFDLMTEHVSLAGILETPFVCIIAQRPGPATGMPSWTSQADLNLALHAGHGEFPRCVIAVRDPEDAFYSIQEAFNIAEQYQCVVLVLTDKLIAESFYTTPIFDQNRIAINRGELITDPTQLAGLKSTDRYKLTDSGISPRWLPGVKAADFDANSDEHDEEGNITEEAIPAASMIAKRQRKLQSLLATLPEPEIITNKVDAGSAKAVVNFIGWGSTWGVMHDLLELLEAENIKVNYLHVKYLWPLRTETIASFLQANPNTIDIEGNHDGQLAQLIRQQTGIEIQQKILKYDGRPFFIEDVVRFLEEKQLI